MKRDVFRRFIRNKATVFVCVCVAIIGLLAIVGPSLNPWEFNAPNPELTFMPPRIQGIERLGIFDGSQLLRNRRADNLDNPEIYPPGSVLDVINLRFEHGTYMADIRVNAYIMRGVCDKYFWFGTDYLGRDLWTRLWRGTRLSLTISLTAVLLNTVIGVLFGAVCGYYGGKVDMLLMRIPEILDSLPQIAVWTLLIIWVGPGSFAIILALCIRGWTTTARLVRARFLSCKEQEYVLAARVNMAKDRRIIFSHILPNAIGPVITRAMAAIPGAIFLESFLAYLGLSVAAPEASLGVLIADGRLTLLTMPSQTFFPALVLSLLMISFNVLSFGLREAMDPTRRGEL